MSLTIADQMLDSLISKEECRDCSQYQHEFTGGIVIPLCKKRWFGEKCVKEDGEDKE